MFLDNSEYIKFLEEKIKRLELRLEKYEGEKRGKYEDIPILNNNFPKEYVLRNKASLEFKPMYDSFCRDAIILHWQEYRSVLYMDASIKHNIEGMGELYLNFFYRLMKEYQEGKTRTS